MKKETLIKKALYCIRLNHPTDKAYQALYEFLRQEINGLDNVVRENNNYYYIYSLSGNIKLQFEKENTYNFRVLDVTNLFGFNNSDYDDLSYWSDWSICNPDSIGEA